MAADAENQPTATGASPNPEGQDPSPRSDPKPAFDEGAFKAGFGKGAERGRREGAAAILESLGLPPDPDEARAALESLKIPKTKGDQADRGETQDPRITELAKVAKKYEGELVELRRRSEILERQADEARREKIRTVATRSGVGVDQSDALLALYGDRISMDESGVLQVISEVAGEQVSGVVKVEDFIGEILKERPWLAAPRSTGGSGFSVTSGSAPAAQSAMKSFDSRPLRERLKR